MLPTIAPTQAKPVTFSIYKNNAPLTTISAAAKAGGKFTYEGVNEYLPGPPQTWTIEVPEETWRMGILIAPDAMLGGGVQLSFEIPAAEPEPELIPLVPLVPLVPLAPVEEPAAAPAPVEAQPEPAPVVEEPVPQPIAEPAPVVEEPAPQPVAEPQPKATEESEEAIPPPVDEIPMTPVEEPLPQEATQAETATPKTPENGPNNVMIEVRLGANLAIQSLKTYDPIKKAYNTDTHVRPMFAAGLSVDYILPVWSERLRLGLSVDYSRYSYSEILSGGTSEESDMDLTLMSIPIMAELNVFILTKGLAQPFVGLGVGGNYVSVDSRSIPVDKNLDITDVEIRKWTYAAAFWAGVQFNVWQGGPFIKARYMISQTDYSKEIPNLGGAAQNREFKLTNAEHGGLSLLAGYQFVF